MINNKLFLFVGTGMSLVPIITFAQCVSPVQDCYALGYTQTSCPNGKGVKCPFGAGWYCGGIAAQDCIKLGYDKDCTGAGERGSGETCNGKYKFCSCDASYQYTCTGTGYAGGTGSACGGKYVQCSCSSDYEWKNGACQSKGPDYSACKIGTLFYSGGICTNEKLNDKDLLGVVIYEKTSNANGWIMSITPVQASVAWGEYGVDVTELDNVAKEEGLVDVQSSCINTDIIIKYGDISKYPAAWAAKNYKPVGTLETQTWCLPSGGLLKELNNDEVLSAVNAGMLKAGGTMLENVSGTWGDTWSSSEESSGAAWRMRFYLEGGHYMFVNHKGIGASVRPVMAF